MSDSPLLHDLELDLLTELFNIGVSQAATSLSQMVQQEILLCVPRVEFSTPQELAQRLGQQQSVIAISQEIDGPFSAYAMLLFAEHNSLMVVRQMLGNQLSEETLAELQQEALSEIGNIVLNACIGAISQGINDSFDIKLPHIKVATPDHLFDHLFDDFQVPSDQETILSLHIDMRLRDSQITSYLAFLLRGISFNQLKQTLINVLINIDTPENKKLRR